MLRIGIPALLVGILLTIYFAPEAAAFVYETIAFFAPIWLPLLLAYLAWPLWLTFVRSRYVSQVPYTTIELKPGSETPKTARPMELVFYSLYHRSEVTKRDFLLGRVRLPWSFEIYAHAGGVRFFVHLPSEHRTAVEGRIRSEYHDIEMDEVRDYSREIPFHASHMRVAIREYALTKADPYPLKTYESREAEREQKDPFVDMLEELAMVGKEEHVLISYIVRSHQRERRSYFEDPRDSLHDDAYHVIADIVGIKGDVHTIPPPQQAVVVAIENSLKKPSFDCGIRALYVAEKKAFDWSYEQKLDALFSRFNDETLNSFTAYDPAERTGLLASEMFAVSGRVKAAHFMRLFRRRAFFAPPYEGKPFVLNTEELATVFHMPHSGRGSVLAHRASVKLEPPENLPV